MKLTNKKQVTDYAMFCASKRAHRFTRMGSDFLEQIESDTRAAIAARVAQQPSKGKTLRAI